MKTTPMKKVSAAAFLLTALFLVGCDTTNGEDQNQEQQQEDGDQEDGESEDGDDD
ncbi:hypothetical protein ACX80O_00245 [Arthrobacter sp. Hz1]